MSWMEQGDELTEDDLKFIERWEKIGHSETADAEYQPEEGNSGDTPDPEGVLLGEIDPELEGDEPGGEEGDEVDESKLDLSNIEGAFDDRKTDVEEGNDEETELSDEAEERDRLQAGDSDSEIPDSESDLEYDDFYDDISDADDDVDDLHDEDGDLNAENSDHEHGKAEDEFEGDERANTDKAIEDLDEYERERDEREAEASEDEAPEGSSEPEAEMEDDRDDPPAADSGSGRDDSDERDSGSGSEDDLDKPAEQEPEDLIDKQDAMDQEAERDSNFESIPEPTDRCTNHCEDNDDERSEEECPHCSARIQMERELWGAIATDKHGRDILPGDKLRVVIPMPFTLLGALLTANVPNTGVDPTRVAESTAGEIDETVCWLSGHSISQFTGWHMTEDGAIWTFQNGKKLRFVEKVGEPEYQRHGSNDLDGDQLDHEDLIDKFKEEMEKELGNDAEADSGNEDEDVGESGTDENAKGDSELPDDEEVDEEPEESEERHREQERHAERQLTGTQKQRFENLKERIEKKLRETFGSTLEEIEITDTVEIDGRVQCFIEITSRGVTYSMGFAAQRSEL